LAFSELDCLRWFLWPKKFQGSYIVTEKQICPEASDKYVSLEGPELREAEVYRMTATGQLTERVFM
jgi:hypothetical protein